MKEYKIWQVPEDDPVVFREYGFCSLDRILERHPAFRGGGDTSSGPAGHLLPAPPLSAGADISPAGGITLEGKAEATLPREAWECVYIYRTDAEPSLDWLFARFQHGAGRAGYLADQRARETELSFTGHSLSVSDIIETPDGKLWFCDSFGWKEVTWRLS